MDSVPSSCLALAPASVDHATEVIIFYYAAVVSGDIAPARFDDATLVDSITPIPCG
jgi:hypothetical protein